MAYWLRVLARATKDTINFLSLHKVWATLGTPLLAPFLFRAVFGGRSLADVGKICASVLMAYGVVLVTAFFFKCLAAPVAIDREQTNTIAGLRNEIERLQQNGPALRLSEDRVRAARDQLATLEEFQRQALGQLVICGEMMESQATQYVDSRNLGHFNGILNSIHGKTHFINRDFAGQYRINPTFKEILEQLFAE
jgi:hypothetical protein